MVVAVGERALALYERPDGRYDVFASQWAGEWAAIAAVLASDGTHPAVLDRYRWERRDAGPRAALLAGLDYPIRARLGCRWLKAAAGRAVETGLLSVPQAVRLLVLFLLPRPQDVPPAVAAWLDTASVFIDDCACECRLPSCLQRRQ
ncbi:hypothetical protein BRD08_05630 [Halobacteriales archaeon SW_10_66_29]|nr:MAG: hypothetical protein BRD08_05630 [Halobacteriales archaeon SW_10_66_29]